METILWGTVFLALLVIGLCFYFLPFTTAYTRHSKYHKPIFIINLFLGWTFVGWVVALAWAYID